MINKSDFIKMKALIANSVLTTWVGENNSITDFSYIVPRIFTPNVLKVVIADPYIRTDAQQHHLYLWLCYIAKSCLTETRDPSEILHVSIISNPRLIFNVDYTEYWDTSIHNIFQNIAKAAGLIRQNTEFSYNINSKLHDRKIIVYSKCEGGACYSINLGRGVSFWFPTCKQHPDYEIVRTKDKNNTEFFLLNKIKTRNRDFKPQHYKDCVKSKTLNDLKTQSTDVTVLKWISMEINPSNLFSALEEFLKKG